MSHKLDNPSFPKHPPPPPPTDPDNSDNSQQSQDYYEYERKKIEAQLSLLKTKKNNQILQELKKNTASQMEYLDQFEDEIVELHKITRNNDKNVLQESVIKQIKQKVFNQSMMHTMYLADQQLQKKWSKQQVIEKQQKAKKQIMMKKQGKEKVVDETESRLNKKMESARMEREIMQMGREDDLSMRYQQAVLSEFFGERFYEPDFRMPETKTVKITIENYAPKPTFTNLKPLPNTQNNVLPRNAPELALRKLARTKKITFVSSSMSEVPVKVKKLNPEIQDTSAGKMEGKEKKGKGEEKNEIEKFLEEYLSRIKPFIPQIQKASQNYHPKYIPEFRSQSQQNYNIQTLHQKQNTSSQKQKSLESFIQSQHPQSLKNLKLTFQHLTNLSGIQSFSNLQHASLQFNILTIISGIEKCQKLVQLNLSKNKIKNIQSLKNLKYLRVLDIEGNMVDKLELKGGALEILNAGYNRIQEIVDLSDNVYLRRLSINNNNLHELGGLSGSFFLQQIDAHNNFITTLQGTQNCLSLRSLNLTNNRLSSFHLSPNSPTFTYLFLHTLNLSHNHLTSLPPMFLPSLQQLYLNHNRIRDQSEIKGILYLPSLKLLDLDENRIGGFGVVWAFLRFGARVGVVRYQQNEYFRDLREKVRQLFEHILYHNLPKLSLLNHNPTDLGMQKYYESTYSSHLTQKSFLLPESPFLAQIHKKLLFTIKQNQAISEFQDRKIKFAETEIFVRHKVRDRGEDLVQILGFLAEGHEERKGRRGIMHATKSLFYEHDRFQYGMRASLAKISNLLISKQYRRKKRVQYFKTNKPKLASLIQYLQKHIITKKLLHILHIFHQPLQRMSLQKAAIIIQKNWRCYRLRKKYLRIIKKLRQQKGADSDLQEIDLDQYDFDKVELQEFNFQLPEDMDFDQFIIKPEIFQMLNRQERERERHIDNNSVVSVRNNNNQGSHNNNNRQNGPGPQRNNFMNQNQSQLSQQQQVPLTRQQIRQEKIQKIMKQWGVNREAAVALAAKNQMKEQKKRKEAEKNMSAAERYQKLKKSHR